ncbi:hypothetical protein, partial [Spirulina sp. 06S082]|uniref:VMAP-C domain-containing protein n=1 Tax=Spirulina sp. 06S082 TaxID=3110248 RepID=UPI002B20C481
MNGDSIDARDSQGFLNNLENVDQQFGDRIDIKTKDGDVAQRDIHKSITKNYNFFEVIGFGQIDRETLTGSDFSELYNLIDRIDRKIIDTIYCNIIYRDDTYLFSMETTNRVKMLNNLNKLRRLEEFCETLSQESTLDLQLRKKLQHIAQKFTDCQDTKMIEDNSLSNKKKKFKSYLIATLQSFDIKEQEFLLNAWLIIDDSIESLQKYKSLLPHDEKQQGILCSLDCVPKKFNEFLKKARKLLRGERYDLTIEFFLPSHLMCLEIDCWHIDAPKNKKISLGEKYPIRLRSLERLDRDYLDFNFSEWCDRWDEVQDILHSKPNLELFEHIERMDSFDEISLKNKLEAKIGLKLTCAPPKSKQKKLFDLISEAITPIAIWTRCDILHLDCLAAIDDLLS